MNSTTLKILVLSIILTIAGCATRPENISASFVSHEKYVGNDCTQLSHILSDTKDQLTKLSAMQDSVANIDAATLFFTLIPASKLSGDHAEDIAKYKGEVGAIETAQIKNGCDKNI